MTPLQRASLNYPISLFLLLSFGWTWLFWFGSLLFNDDWAIRKIITGMGFGPAIAAIVLSALSGKRCLQNSRRWWLWFGSSLMLLFISYLSMLLTGDSINAATFMQAVPPGVTPVNLLLSGVSAGIGAFIVAATLGGETPVFGGYLSLTRGVKWLLFASLLPALWLVAGLMVAYLQGEAPAGIMADLSWLTWLGYSIRSVLFTLLVVAIGEELGWRGWLLPALQQRLSPLVSAVLLGIAWGLWHFPLFVNGSYNEPPQMVFAKVGLCIFLSVIFSFFYNRTAGNVLVAILLHTALNSSQRFIPLSEHMGLFMLATIVLLPFIDKMWRKDLSALTGHKRCVTIRATTEPGRNTKGGTA